jgi:hypothetical protein
MILTNIKKGLAAAVAASLLAVSFSAPVNAASGTTTLSVTLNELVILYYYDNISFEISAADLVKYLEPGADANDAIEETAGGNDLGTVSLASGEISGDVTMTPTIATLTEIEVTIANAWAVRSIDADGALVAAVTVSGATLTNPGGGTIGLSITGSGTNDTAPTSGLTLQTGDIVFNMDVSNADRSGDYTGGSVLITVTNT